MIIATQPYRDGEIKEPFLLQWTQIISGQHIGKWATNEINLNYFDEIFENLTYEIVDLDATDFQVDYTPPTLTPYAVVIPEIYQWAFPQDKFILSGFEIPLDTHNQDKVVNIAYFMWEEFRAELDSGNYVALKRSLMPLWDYVAEQVANNNLILV
jgi:hypothetical protein